MSADSCPSPAQLSAARCERLAELQSNLSDGPAAEAIQLLLEELQACRARQAALEKEVSDLQIELQLRGVFRQSCCD
ncbi:hypothetical protein LOC68_07540 [Blastopirellula sp. JC732]|uniref:Uncharacterized protein n=1 Tax=Blastopirellula sediminis TaxID=2894196 RepID=A0A9X1SFF5_9BACT|nr:hypothetical protein [Blastopirellula sediminis]MCC9608980.1 hypothetical protein [Blastopirellula sediminis]MCC9628243.1 hypothetical protein [Blastopirellula sediminis]